MSTSNYVMAAGFFFLVVGVFVAIRIYCTWQNNQILALRVRLALTEGPTPVLKGEVHMDDTPAILLPSKALTMNARLTTPVPITLRSGDTILITII